MNCLLTVYGQIPRLFQITAREILDQFPGLSSLWRQPCGSISYCPSFKLLGVSFITCSFEAIEPASQRVCEDPFSPHGVGLGCMLAVLGLLSFGHVPKHLATWVSSPFSLYRQMPLSLLPTLSEVSPLLGQAACTSPLSLHLDRLHLPAWMTR